MRTWETRLAGPMLIELQVFGDARGFFAETYRHSVFSDLGIAQPTVQDNHSRSHRGSCAGCTSRSALEPQS